MMSDEDMSVYDGLFDFNSDDGSSYDEWCDEYDGICDSDDMDYEPYRLQNRSDQQEIDVVLSMTKQNDECKSPLSLMDMCATNIALNFPFAYIEDRVPPIPENVQLKIINYSFPQDVEKIKRYCLLVNGSSSEYDKAIQLIKSVKDLSQIGFHLGASIANRGYEQRYNGTPVKRPPDLYVNVKFDRGKITETNCLCGMNTQWCSHAIAVCLARIYFHDKCIINLPLSDSLNNLKTYQELRTFTQYLIAEFSDRRIVESAQKVLDRMLSPAKCDTDAIHVTWGAPDPTAGPGLGETSQWLICEESLKSRCKTLVQNSSITRRCWGMNIASLNETTSVIERWKQIQIEKPVVEAYFTALEVVSGSYLFSYNFCKKQNIYSRDSRGQEITKFLESCEELLKDDFGYSQRAVQAFTAQLVEERKKGSHHFYSVASEKFESNLHFGCTPRPQVCWLFCDQVARLWRLLVLNPSISGKEREEIVSTLEKLDTKFGSDGVKQQGLDWGILKHITGLKSFNWQSLQLADDPNKHDSLSEISVSKSIFLETSSRGADSSEKFPYPVHFTCADFSSSLTVFCYLVEALIVYGRKSEGVDLAMNLALAVVRYYSAWLENRLTLDVRDTLCVDYEEGTAQENENKKEGGKRKQKKRKRGRPGAVQILKRGRHGSKKAEEVTEKSENVSNEMLYNQEIGIIPVTSFAYLMNILKQNEDAVAEMLKLVKLRSLGISEGDMMECDDVTCDARSLIFRLAVIGAAIPKIQAPSLQTQVEWFNWEVYISQKILNCTPSSGDFDFLRMITFRMMSLCEFGFPPPYVLVLNLFEHSWKPELTEVDEKAEESVDITLKAIVASSWRQRNGGRIHRRFFLESLRRHWVKLCEVVLYRVNVDQQRLNAVLRCVCSATHMIGSTTGENDWDVTDERTSRHKQFVQSMIMEKTMASNYLALALAKRADDLAKTPLERLGVIVVSEPTKNAKAPFNKQQLLLYHTAIDIATRVFAVKNVTLHKLNPEWPVEDYNFLEFLQRSLIWLIESKRSLDVEAFDIIMQRQLDERAAVKCFNDEEMIKICKSMVLSRKEREDRVWIKVKDALLTLITPDSNTIIGTILDLCRDVEVGPSSKPLLVVPAICKKLLTFIPESSMEARTKMEYLVRAMTVMHSLFKKLDSGEQENLEGVKELFSEITTSNTDMPSTSDESNKHETLHPNLQLCFDLAIESVKQISVDTNEVRSYDGKQRYERICDVIVFVARRACKSSDEQSAEASENAGDKIDEFEEGYITRFVEVLCNCTKDFLLVTDFFFELASKLLDLSQHHSFGRDGVMLSDDYRVETLCNACSSLSVLLKRCIAGLRSTTQGETMERYLKDTSREDESYLKLRSKNASFYSGASLVSVLEVLKRLMSISEENDFEPFSYNLAAKHPIAKIAIEELDKSPSTSPSSESVFRNRLLSTLLLQRMFSPSTRYLDYDSDEWYY